MKLTVPKSITPTKLRIILSATLVLLMAAGVGLFYFAYNGLDEAATAAGQSAASAREGEDTLQRLQTLRSDLDSKKDIIERTSRVVANSQNYAYQDQLVTDLTAYARRANLTIKNISFSSSQPTTTAPTTPTDGAPATTGAPAGLNKATVDISLENPVNYLNLLNFLHYVEQNLTKLKVSKVVMTSSQDSAGVTIDVLNLEVYVR